LAGKYDPLRDYLAALGEDNSQLSMAFTDIEGLVGELPAAARNRPSWWTHTVSAAGWHAESVSPTNETVLLIRDSQGKVQAGLQASRPDQATLGGRTSQASEPGAGEGRGESALGLTRRSVVGDLAVGVVVAVGAVVSAVTGVTHIPVLAMSLLTFVVGAIGFTIPQAITTRSVPDASRKWWAISTALLILLCTGVPVYHEEFDPADHGPPFSWTVQEDPAAIVSQGCRTVVIPGEWHNIAPPAEPLTDVGVNQWEASHHGIDADETAIVIELQGTTDQAVVINPPQVIVSARKSPVKGTATQLSGGCGSTESRRVFEVNLDEQQPLVTLKAGASYPPTEIGGQATAQAASQSFRISASDPEYFVIIARTGASFCQWYISLNWLSMGKAGTLFLSNDGRPFETTASGNLPVHHLIFGSWR
jgi:hypothetical protein